MAHLATHIPDQAVAFQGGGEPCQSPIQIVCQADIIQLPVHVLAHFLHTR